MTAAHGVALAEAEAVFFGQHRRLWSAQGRLGRPGQLYGDCALPRSLLRAVGAYHRALTGQVRDPYALAAGWGDPPPGAKRRRARQGPDAQPLPGLGKAPRLANDAPAATAAAPAATLPAPGPPAPPPKPRQPGGGPHLAARAAIRKAVPQRRRVTTAASQLRPPARPAARRAALRQEPTAMLLDHPPDQLEAPEQAPEAIMLDQPARRETLLLDPPLLLLAPADPGRPHPVGQQRATKGKSVRWAAPDQLVTARWFRKDDPPAAARADVGRPRGRGPAGVQPARWGPQDPPPPPAGGRAPTGAAPGRPVTRKAAHDGGSRGGGP